MIKIDEKTYFKVCRRCDKFPSLSQFKNRKRTVFQLTNDLDIKECDLMEDYLIYIPWNIDFNYEYVIFVLL